MVGFLLGKRKGAHGVGSWAPPGGHLEYREDIFDCARREVREETDLTITNPTLRPFTNDFFESEQKHYVTLFVLADYDEGEVVLKEPDKCEQWDWFSWDELPKPLFLPVQNLIQQGFSPIGKEV